MNWTSEQLDAINKNNTNIIVSAGAGSGKTAVLTQRVINKLQNNIKINELLILTFTNAAAGEMKERIRKAISKDENIKDNLDYIESSYITTFDSFTLSLVKKYNYLLNVSDDINIVNSNIISFEKEKILDEIFDELYLEKNDNFFHLINDLCIKNDKNLKESILKIINKIDLKSNKEQFLKSYILCFYNDDKINSYIKDYQYLIIDKIDSIENYLSIIKDTTFKDYADKLEIVLEPLIYSKEYDDIKLNANVSLPKRPSDSDEIKDIKSNIDSLLKEVKELTRFKNKNEILLSFSICKNYLSALINILERFYDKISIYKRENDLYEFNDIELMAISLLKDNKDICEEIKNYYKEIMVDEYQDTNDLQEEFISLISNNNVYMVGDIKQSIYGFRNANPKIFQEKYDLYSENNGGIKIDLLKNFRSRSEVLNNINEIFNLIMDNFLGGANYKKEHQMIFGNDLYTLNNNKNQNYNLEILDYNNEEKEYKDDEIECFIIGNDIKSKINNYEVLDSKTNILRKANYEDFCIIMDRNSAFDTYKKVFEYLGIPVSIYEDKHLTNSTDIMIINNILSLIISIYNNKKDINFKYSFVSIARSYLFSYSDKETFRIIKDNSYEETSIYKLASDIANSLNNHSISYLLNEIIDKFNIYEKIINNKDIEESLIRIDYLKETARELENLGYTPEAFNEYLHTIIDSDKEIDYKGFMDSENSVKLMNIHKSKGLEFPVCYYSGFNKTFNISDIKEKLIYDEKYGIITPYFDEGECKSILKDLYISNYYIDNISEKIRLLYVALTRAKEKIIIVTNVNDLKLSANSIVDISIRKDYKSFKNIIDSINGNLNKYINNIDLKSIVITKDYKKSKKSITLNDSLVKDVIKHSEISINNSIIEKAHASKIINEIITKEKKELLLYGTKMHEILENADFLSVSNNNQYYDMIINIVNTFKINKDTKIYKEHEFIYTKDKIEYHGIIDLVLVSDDIKIVDYKLTNIDDEKYKVQLKIYYDYLKTVFNKDIKVYLYSIMDNSLKEIIVNE